MKTRILLLAFILCCANLMHSQKSVNKLINKLKDDEYTYGLKIPGWLIDQGISKSIKDQEAEEEVAKLEGIKDKIKEVRILFNFSKKFDFSHALKEFYAALPKENFEKLITVKHKKFTSVDIYTREDKGKMTNIVFVGNTSGAKFIMSVKTDMKPEDFNKINLDNSLKIASIK